MSDNTASEYRIYGSILFIIALLLAIGMIITQPVSQDGKILQPNSTEDSDANNLTRHTPDNNTSQPTNYNRNVSEVTEELLTDDQLVTIKE